MFTRILAQIHRWLYPPKKDRCCLCLDELLLPFEVEQGTCVDCLQPPFLRRFAPESERHSS